VVIGAGHLRRRLVDDLPEPGTDFRHDLRREHVAAVLDQVVPDDAATEPERAQHVVQRNALLGAPATGLARRFEDRIGVVAGGCAADRLGEHLQHPVDVVVTRQAQVVVRDADGVLIAGVLVLDGLHQPVGQRLQALTAMPRDELDRGLLGSVSGSRHRALPAAGVTRKSAKSKPGETTQLTTTSPWARAYCTASAGTTACGVRFSVGLPSSTSCSSTMISTLPGPCHSHSSSEATVCGCEVSPSHNRYRIDVAVARLPQGRSTCCGLVQVRRYQPPSGCGSKPRSPASAG